MIIFYSFHGTITMINDFAIGSTNNEQGCYKLVSIDNGHGNFVNFVVSPSTYFVNHEMISVGDIVTGYYDANAPAPLIFPPQYQALIMAKDNPYQNIKVDYFNNKLISSDGQLKLNLSPATQMILTNNQIFTGNLTNRNLITIYGPTTRSIPAQTTPYKIIVLCA